MASRLDALHSWLLLVDKMKSECGQRKCGKCVGFNGKTGQRAQQRSRKGNQYYTPFILRSQCLLSLTFFSSFAGHGRTNVLSWRLASQLNFAFIAPQLGCKADGDGDVDDVNVDVDVTDPIL